MIPGAVHRSPGICLTYWRKPRKTSARRPSNEGAVRPVIASNGVPLLQMRSEWSHSTSGREKEGIREGQGIEKTSHLGMIWRIEWQYSWELHIKADFHEICIEMVRPFDCCGTCGHSHDPVLRASWFSLWIFNVHLAAGVSLWFVFPSTFSSWHLLSETINI